MPEEPILFCRYGPIVLTKEEVLTIINHVSGFILSHIINVVAAKFRENQEE